MSCILFIRDRRALGKLDLCGTKLGRVVRGEGGLFPAVEQYRVIKKNSMCVVLTINIFSIYLKEYDN